MDDVPHDGEDPQIQEDPQSDDGIIRISKSKVEGIIDEMEMTGVFM